MCCPTSRRCSCPRRPRRSKLIFPGRRWLLSSHTTGLFKGHANILGLTTDVELENVDNNISTESVKETQVTKVGGHVNICEGRARQEHATVFTYPSINLHCYYVQRRTFSAMIIPDRQDRYLQITYGTERDIRKLAASTFSLYTSDQSRSISDLSISQRCKRHYSSVDLGHM